MHQFKLPLRLLLRPGLPFQAGDFHLQPFPPGGDVERIVQRPTLLHLNSRDLRYDVLPHPVQIQPLQRQVEAVRCGLVRHDEPGLVDGQPLPVLRLQHHHQPLSEQPGQVGNGGLAVHRAGDFGGVQGKLPLHKGADVLIEVVRRVRKRREDEHTAAMESLLPL